MGTTEEIVKMCANPFFRGKKVKNILKLAG